MISPSHLAFASYLLRNPDLILHNNFAPGILTPLAGFKDQETFCPETLCPRTYIVPGQYVPGGSDGRMGWWDFARRDILSRFGGDILSRCSSRATLATFANFGSTFGSFWLVLATFGGFGYFWQLLATFG